MEYRLRRVPETAFRIVRDRVGGQFDDGLRRLIEMWADGKVDPLAPTAAEKAVRDALRPAGGQGGGPGVG